MVLTYNILREIQKMRLYEKIVALITGNVMAIFITELKTII
jgi:hypothetical protein